MSDHIVVLVTASTEEEAKHIAGELVDRKLAACANLLPVSSVFRWEDSVQHEGEILLVIKTRGALFTHLQAAVKALHSYDVPEIIALPIIAGTVDYLNWIDNETASS